MTLRRKLREKGIFMGRPSYYVKLQTGHPIPGVLPGGDKPPLLAGGLLGQIESMRKAGLHTRQVYARWLALRQGGQRSAEQLLGFPWLLHRSPRPEPSKPLAPRAPCRSVVLDLRWPGREETVPWEAEGTQSWAGPVLRGGHCWHLLSSIPDSWEQRLYPTA